MVTKFIEKKDVAHGTMSFTFEKPAGFSFKAGQNIDLTLINPAETDDQGSSRTFSIVSSPEEQTITVATRMRDTAFKRNLKNMEPGTEVEMSDAMGSFTLQNDSSKPAVFLIGGIGITPVMSILADAAAKQLPHKIFLFYSNRRPEDSAFLAQIEELQQKNPNFTFVPTMTQMDQSQQPWSGQTGYITADMIKGYVPDADAVWYLSGPASMVKAMRDILSSMNVNDDFIKTEEFSGY